MTETLRFITCLSLTLIPMLFSCPGPVFADHDPYDWAFVELDYARQEKYSNLGSFMQKLHKLARQSVTDDQVLSFFDVNRQFFHLGRWEKPPEGVVEEVESLRRRFDRYYLTEYYAFHDMIFVDLSGDVFYSIRKALDFNTNLIRGSDRIGALGKAIAAMPTEEVFVDFYEYNPSAEPASFFIEPVVENGTLTGWLCLQAAGNKPNSIFASTDDLGRTGETFLVNDKGLMLTESYFKGNSTILKQHLDDRNIKPKFEEKKGHRIVTDYRNQRALTSFEVFPFLGTRWLIVAKIDKNEVTTNYYRSHRKYFGDRLKAFLRNRRHSPEQNSCPAKISALRVDMDEFVKAEHHELLETWGITTCKGFVAYVPRKFAYLAHISPKDKIYNGHETNLIAQITKKLKNFDVYPSERHTVEFLIVGPHLETLKPVVDMLVDSGFMLSQIHTAYYPGAESAAIVFDYSRATAAIRWSLNDGSERIHDLGSVVTIGEALETIMENGNQ